MKRTILSKLSGAFLRAHRHLDSRVKMGSDFRPYKVRYPDVRGTKRIVHVIGNFIVGGSSQLVVDIIEGTSDEYDHKVVVPYPDPNPAYQPIDIRSFPIDRLQEFARWLEEEKPELVHVHYFVRDTDRFSEGQLWYSTVFKICEELGLGVVQNVNIPTHPERSPAVVHNVFVSKYVADNFNNSAAEHSVIYPGSDFEHFRNDDVDSLPAKAIGMVYRLDSDKLRLDAIEVFISVVKKNADIRCYIVGAGEFLDRFKARVREENLDESFVFTGFISYEDLPSYYRKFSIFVAPVHEESFGQVTPFAMSMGLVVAGYKTGALEEILGSSETLVRTGRVDELAELILKLVSDREQWSKISRHNKARAMGGFSVGSMVRSYRRLYQNASATTEE